MRAKSRFATYAIRRITLVADDVPEDSFIRACWLSVDYDYVPVSGTEFLLPVHASLLVQRHGRALNRTELDFQNYRKYGAESTFTAMP